jgi:tetratricopeptide (TPR) repeat protein
MRYFLLFSVFLLTSQVSVWAQNPDNLSTTQNIDVLKAELKANSLTTKDRIEKLHEIGQLFFDRPDSTVHYLNRALVLSRSINDSVLISDTFINMSLVEMYNDDYDRTLKYIDSAVQNLNKRNENHFLNIGIANTIGGIAYNNNERMDLAFEKILEANRFLNKAPVDVTSQSYLVENYSSLALIYFNIEEYDNTIENAKQALERAKHIEAFHNIADIYNILATTYTEKEEYTLAEIYLDSSAQTFKEINYVSGEVMVLSDKGQLLLRKGKYSSAKMEFKKALARGKDLGDVHMLVSIFLDLSTTYFRNNEIAMAKEYLDSAYLASRDVDFPLFSNKISLAETQILKKEKNFTRAIKLLEDNVAYMQSLNLRESRLETYDELFQLYKETGDAENSLLYFEKYTQLKDSLRQELNTGKLNVLHVEHNYNQVVSDLEKTETQLALAGEAQKRIKHRNYFLSGLAGLIILFSVFVFFRQRKLSLARRAILESKQEVLYVKQQALDNKVRFKNKQITDFAIHISEKNELLETIKSKLKSIKVTNDTYKEIVNDTMHFINNDIEQNKEKIQLYQQVNETTDSFRAKINEMYNNLSDKEKKVATMLRLGQTSKQIALLLNISAASVDNYRYTIRKKMNIPKGESLKMFIQNI